MQSQCSARGEKMQFRCAIFALRLFSSRQFPLWDLLPFLFISSSTFSCAGGLQGLCRALSWVDPAAAFLFAGFIFPFLSFFLFLFHLPYQDFLYPGAPLGCCSAHRPRLPSCVYWPLFAFFFFFPPPLLHFPYSERPKVASSSKCTAKECQ